jgi:hypothetical protein
MFGQALVGFCATLVHDVHMMFLMMFNDAYNAFVSAIQSQIAHYLSSFLSFQTTQIRPLH